MLHDEYNQYDVKRAISPLAGTDDTAFVSQVIDLQGYDSCTFYIATGTLADAGATFTTLLEHDTASGFGTATAVDDADMLGTEAAASFTQANDDSVFKLGYKGSKRYVRLTITPSGNASSAPVAAVCVLRKEKIGTL